MSCAVCLQVGWLKYSCQVLSIFGDGSIISPTVRREPTFRATRKTNGGSQALVRRALTTSEASAGLCQFQAAGGRLGGDIPHAHKHTLTLSYTASMGNLGTEGTVGLYTADADSAIPVSKVALKARQMPPLSP